jgi:hypothetical protein
MPKIKRSPEILLDPILSTFAKVLPGSDQFLFIDQSLQDINFVVFSQITIKNFQVEIFQPQYSKARCFDQPIQQAGHNSGCIFQGWQTR